MKLISVSDIVTERPRGLKDRQQGEKYPAKCIKLNNNHLQDMKGLQDVFEQVLLNPTSVTWIDLSFNELTHIDPALSEFKQLQILYLHGNRIDDISEVDKLSSVTSLKKLALHGNSIENVKNYRSYVISRLPSLISLDMSLVTRADREVTSRFYGNHSTMSHRSKHPASSPR